jgi:hypothetical protein
MDHAHTKRRKTDPSAIVDYLENEYGNLSGPVPSNNSLNGFGESIPLVGRSELIRVAKELFQERYNSRAECDRNLHKIGVIGGRSGIGKSRALLHLANEFPNCKNAAAPRKWNISIFMTYNNGSLPSIEVNANIPPDKGLALRILYYGLIHSTTRSFHDFIKSMPKEILDCVDPTTAIQSIELLCRRWNPDCDPDGMVYIAVDEVNNLLVAQKSVNLSQRESGPNLLKSTIVALVQIVMHRSSFVYPVVAATTVIPLDEAFRASSHPTRKFPIGLLTFNDLEELMKAWETSHPNWNGWGSSRKFRMILNDVAVLPKATTLLLETVSKRMSTHNETLLTMDWNAVEAETASVFKISTPLIPLSFSLISDVILGTACERRK